ncbi:hypothetical protein HK105_203723 [Polyrhizophydium stewartii]|uniref:Uncharacterized protein n=1 Tax=Polyrhizophydium stewartii TaxID=2732419 RepID=A0ABR4NAS0_9FUNG
MSQRSGAQKAPRTARDPATAHAAANPATPPPHTPRPPADTGPAVLAKRAADRPEPAKKKLRPMRVSLKVNDGEASAATGAYSSAIGVSNIKGGTRNKVRARRHVAMTARTEARKALGIVGLSMTTAPVMRVPPMVRFWRMRRMLLAAEDAAETEAASPHGAGVAAHASALDPPRIPGPVMPETFEPSVSPNAEAIWTRIAVLLSKLPISQAFVDQHCPDAKTLDEMHQYRELVARAVFSRWIAYVAWLIKCVALMSQKRRPVIDSSIPVSERLMRHVLDLTALEEGGFRKILRRLAEQRMAFHQLHCVFVGPELEEEAMQYAIESGLAGSDSRRRHLRIVSVAGDRDDAEGRANSDDQSDGSGDAEERSEADSPAGGNAASGSSDGAGSGSDNDQDSE